MDDSLHGVTLFDISPQIVAEYYSEAHSVFGHKRQVLRFATHEEAVLATAIDRHHNVGTTDDVVAYLLHSPATVRRTFGITYGHRLAWPIRATEYAWDEPCTITSGIWTRILDAVDSDADPCGVSRLVAIVPVTRAAVTIAIVHHHWCREDDHSLVHRSHTLYDTTLRFVPHALYGGHVELEIPDAYEWPCWMEECRGVDPMRLPVLRRCPSPVCLSLPEAGRKRAIDVDTLECGVWCKRVVTRWGKSHMARGVDAPYLVECRHLDALGDAQYRTRDGTLVAERVVDLDAIHATVHHVYEERFGLTYANESIQRTANDTRCGIYAVRLHDGTLLGAFTVVLYNCILGDGIRSVAVMIDTFAVLRKWSGSGHGGRMFHDLICAIGSRHGTERFAVFAQCVRTGDAPKFWYDKLDESGTARSLVLQAYVVDRGSGAGAPGLRS